jgi:hypothetical protein
MDCDLKAFGAALKRLREERSIIQRLVVDRVAPLYSDERAYRRIESGDRRPDRENIIQLLHRGLQENKAQVINRFLRLAGYEALCPQEVHDLQLIADPGPEPEPEKIPAPTKNSQVQALIWTAVAFSLTIYVSGWPQRGFSWFRLVMSVGYASLYAVSLFLETAYLEANLRIWPPAIGILSLVCVTSAAALSVTEAMAFMGFSAGVWIGFGVLILAALAQLWLAHLVLPNSEIVKASFHPFTSQAAHFKNTGYFLLLAVPFWLIPSHCIACLEGALATGNQAMTERFLRGSGWLVAGALCVRPAWLWTLAGVMIASALYMGAHLIDNLLPHPKRNYFLNLFYCRAFLYFLLVAICLVHYSLAVARLSDALPSN